MLNLIIIFYKLTFMTYRLYFKKMKYLFFKLILNGQKHKYKNFIKNKIAMSTLSENSKYVEEYTTLANLNEKLKTDGIAVIPNVLSKSQIKSFRKEMWGMFENMTVNLDNPIKEDDELSWKNFFELYPSHAMMIQFWGIGHSGWIWRMRQNPKIIKIFSKIWNVKPEELLVSFDGMSLHLPPETTGRGWYKGNDWFHTDQSRLKKELCCIQGMMTLYDINEGDATFSYKKKSHLKHQSFFEKYKIQNRSDWHRLTEDEFDYFTDNVHQKVKANAGSLILWDSRLFHCGSEPLKTRAKPNFRSVVYICMTPRSFSDEKNLKKKVKAFNNKRTTTHWPHHVRLFNKKPHTFGKKLADIKDVESVEFDDLSDIGKKLAGF